MEGDIAMGSIMAGQIAAMVTKVQPAQQIIDEIISEGKQTLLDLQKFF